MFSLALALALALSLDEILVHTNTVLQLPSWRSSGPETQTSSLSSGHYKVVICICKEKEGLALAPANKFTIHAQTSSGGSKENWQDMYVHESSSVQSPLIASVERLVLKVKACT